MEPDSAAVAATVAPANATATIVVIEDEQPGPSTSKEEGAAAAATEATVATEKGEKKKEVNRKGVCVCVRGEQILSRAPPRGPSPDLLAPTGTGGAPRGWGPRARWGWGAAEQSSIRSPPPFLLAAWRAGAGLGTGAARGGGCPLSWELGALEPLDSPRPHSHSRNWGNRVGDGAVQEKASASPSPLARSLSPPSRRPLPGKSGPFNPTPAQKGSCWGLFF